MAKQTKVYVGYEDEVIEGKRLSTCNYTVDKIGGLPDWPPIENFQFSTKCPVCSLHRPLIVQCCAPIKNTVYTRTLYVFACVNPNCWNQSESWTCIRSQVEERCQSLPTPTVAMQIPEGNLSWCQGSDDWDENENENGNNLMSVDNIPSPNNIAHRISDDDDESNSFDIETVEQALGNLQVFDATNANNFPIQGAVGAVGVPVAEAEIEGKDDSDLVTVDTPTIPTGNIEALFQETAELPSDIRSRLTCGQLQFVPKYLYIEEEEPKNESTNDVEVIELLSKYKRENDMDVNNVGCPGAGDDELYEDSTPLHGDRLFHAFLMRLRRNPDQILRYSRDAPPLLGAPLTLNDNIPPTCCRCNSRLICEMQLVPRFTQTLVLAPNNISLPYLHFLSVLVFTCSQSCWQPSDTVVKEIVVFQPEI